MLFTVLTSALFTIWVIFCIIFYIYYLFKDGYFDSLCSERSISTAHKNLKFLIKSILEEAKNNSNHHEEEECKPILGEQDQTYEGILATAILNKVYSKQNESAISFVENNEILNSEDERFKHNKWDYLDEIESTTSSSSNGFLNITIQQQIKEDLHSTQKEVVVNSNDKSQVLEAFNSESNWLLRKRPIRNVNSPIHVPMLVPNSTLSPKVLIGDREIDETSDLSDANSDTDTNSEEQNFILDSELVFQDKILNDNISEETTSFDSGVRDDQVIIQNNGRKIKKKTKRNKLKVDSISSERSSSALSSENELPVSTRYGRDYYARQASLPSGSNKIKADGTNGGGWILESNDVDEDNELVSSKLENDNYNDHPFWESDNSYQAENHISDIVLDDNISTSKMLSEDTENAPIVENEFDSNISNITILDSKENDNNDNRKNDLSSANTNWTPLNSKTDKKLDNFNKNINNISVNNTEIKNNDQHPTVIKKKSDNTLIKKIYSDPAVRNFAMKNREQLSYISQGTTENRTAIPVKEPYNDIQSKEILDSNKQNPHSTTRRPRTNQQKKYNEDRKDDLSANNNETNESLLEFRDDTPADKKRSARYNEEYNDLKQKGLVASRLSQFSKSYPNLTKQAKKNQNLNNDIQRDINDNYPEKSTENSYSKMPVKELKKIFEKNAETAKDKPVHSLTARSISKEVKQKLGNL